MNEYNGGKAELVLSLDVIYHLVEDDVYNKYMETVFNAAKRYVIIYSSNSEYVEYFTPCPHIKHRRFTDWALEFAKEWKLMEHIPNKYPYKGNHLKGSFADFYIYEKTGF
ncbi:MAG: hypothetical protein LBC53_10840 [Spirochaetaceae bacterium]|jgi:hypothetical protein|nr:hypothetical protein [Spirochaetaceae bacterium]